MTSRTKRLFDGADDVDVILIQNSMEPFFDMTFFWATRMTEGIFENSAILLYPDGRMSLITSLLEAETARKSGIDLITYKNKKEKMEKPMIILRKR